MTTNEITNSQDIIDSRDIITRIVALESDLLDDYEKEELVKLKALMKEADSSEWEFGVTLIREEYFEEYARQFAEDIGAEVSEWPCYCIDWEWAARELQMEYTEVDFDGVSYLYR